MKFITDKTELVQALDRCVAITDQKSGIMPILGSVYIGTNGKEITLCATDLLRAISVDIPAESGATGSVCLPARELYEKVKSLPDGKVAFVCEESKATLKTVGSNRRFTMTGLPGADFPSLPEVTQGDARLDTNTHTLAALISAVYPSICTDSSRLILHAMHMQADDTGIRLTCSDGYRITTVRHGQEEPMGAQWLIPYPSVNDLRKLCATKSDEAVNFTQDRGTLFAEFDGYTYSTKLVDAQYPDCLNIIRSVKAERCVTVDRRALIDAIESVRVAAGDYGGVRLTFQSNALLIQANSSTKGEGFDELETDYAGKTFAIGFNNKLILDSLKVLAVDFITISTSGETDPAVIRIAGDESYLGYVSPMNM